MLCINAEIEAAIWVIAAVCGFFGWRALNAITPDMFLFMSCGAWIVYFVIKGVLSIIIGMFVAPFQIAKMIANAISSMV
ncbi:MAG: hypothetical protein IIX27_00010 [Ruminococcus sp.]|nr:hypothetical protein [Ruminococcus sp.]